MHGPDFVWLSAVLPKIFAYATLVLGCSLDILVLLGLFIADHVKTFRFFRLWKVLEVYYLWSYFWITRKNAGPLSSDATEAHD